MRAKNFLRRDDIISSLFGWRSNIEVKRVGSQWRLALPNIQIQPISTIRYKNGLCWGIIIMTDVDIFFPYGENNEISRTENCRCPSDGCSPYANERKVRVEWKDIIEDA